MSNYDRFEGGPGKNPEEQLEEIINFISKRRGAVIAAAIGLAVLWGGASSYYQIEAEEVGVVLRFGKHIGNSEPGPHFKLPFGVDQVIKVPAKRQLKMEFGFRTTKAGIHSQFSQTNQTKAESEMLTGDLNVAVVEWIVQYKIKSPEKFLFEFRDINTTLRLMSEAVMRSVIGDHSIDEVLTSGREQVEREAKQGLIDLNKFYDTGIVIQQLKLQEVNAPDLVQPALREVEEAKQERERMINEAWSEYNKVIPRARGRAEQEVQGAEGYAVERMNRAKGDANRFNAVYDAYKKAPTVTRTRLYLEAMTEVFAKAKRKVLVDPDVRGVLPLLNLDQKGAKK